MSVANLGLLVRNTLPFISKPKAHIIGPIDQYVVSPESDTLELYVNATRVPGISPHIYRPLYLGLQKPFVPEILKKLREGKETVFDGILDPNITRARDDFERVDDGALIRLKGKLSLGEKIYWTEFDVDYFPFPIWYIYYTNLVNIRRESV